MKMIQTNIPLFILGTYAKRFIKQPITISVFLLVLWSCQRHNASMEKELKTFSCEQEMQKLNLTTVENQPIMDDIEKESNTECALMKRLERIVDLMPLLPEARTRWENRFRNAAAVGTGLAAIGVTTAIAYWTYLWYTQEGEHADSQLNKIPACFNQFHHIFGKYRHGLESYVKEQRDKIYNQPSNADTRPAMLQEIESAYLKYSDQEADLMICFDAAIRTSYDTSWMTPLYYFSAISGVAALGCFVGKEFFGKSSIENQQNRELIALKERTVEAYKRVEKALIEGQRISAIGLLHDEARKSLTEFFAQASDVLGYLVDRKQYALLIKLRDPIHRLAEACEDRATTISGSRAHHKVLEACSSHMEKTCDKIDSKILLMQTIIKYSPLTYNEAVGVSLASTSREESL
ncbi:hypothetical protein [Candidatus Cardinium hertigii]|uniref:Uncharacterized protein n=1 Tax=Candidatus Cardinium hertigii TaxID=247481 RepID=A0A2Z3LHU4_9BACT|nr:hypothetical protein [Candidatus Cardinium hertigii]AWN82014.1 hypothetical protein DK880_00703 [Candidatus Cardinium hertigii]